MALGCDASYEVHVIDRGGAILAVLTDLAAVEWYRVMNATSPCRVEAVANADCCAALGQIRSWRHSIAVYRDGEFQWDGPITSVSWRQGTCTINAGDITAWLARRTPHERLIFGSINTVDIAAALIRDGYNPDDPGHDVQILGRATVQGSRTYHRGIGQTLDWLTDLSDSGGLDFTAVGRTIYVMPDEFAPPVGTVTDDDMPEGLVVTEDGSQLATWWHVYGQDGSGVYGEFGIIDPYYGLLEQSVQDTNIPDNLSAVNAARGLVQSSRDVSVYIDTQNVTLSPDTQVQLQHLVPGWSLDMVSEATCRRVAQRLKITGLHVLADGSGERIQVQVGPLTVGIGA